MGEREKTYFNSDIILLFVIHLKLLF